MNVKIEPTRVYEINEAQEFLADQGIDVEMVAPKLKGKFMSSFIRGSKPVGLPGDSLSRS